MSVQSDTADVPVAAHRLQPGSQRAGGESGQVSISVLLTSLAVIGAALAFMVFAEAVDVRSSTQKSADAAATAAAEDAREKWIEAWLRAQNSPKGSDRPSHGGGILPETGGTDKKESSLKFTYKPPEPFWAAAAASAYPTAISYARKNDGGTVTSYMPGGGNRISVDVYRAKQSESPQGKKFVPTVGGKSSATAQVVAPRGLACAPLPNGTVQAWTLQCVSAKGTATAQYAEGVLVTWDKRAFKKMYTIRLDR
ncbi:MULTISPECIES: hypothetical protein [unclassified Brevibacterium]|uniref:hypothetical protein n=1 Tax=unclassified Brevibacterium TaxID=2614124 RepID=UPI0008A4A3CD|nr:MULTISPECIES: hypothetical protein [unclassified Brevibacterium]OFL68806.1 hypothetical protein HMPREF2757_07835 [Brevibacterium sp. HMSC063G07]